MTFSIAARTPDGSLFGIAIASSSPAVAARCAHARAEVGAVSTQNITDPSLGPQILAELGRGLTAREALGAALSKTPYAAYRQLIVVARAGPPAVHSGSQALGTHSSAVTTDAAAAGNLLANPDVPAAMLEAFEQTAGHLGARLLTALRVGCLSGGEAGPIHSAGLLVVREVSWPIVDLRVDWDERDPVAALSSIWDIYAPQIDDYVTRALDPTRAPTFRVPGDP